MCSCATEDGALAGPERQAQAPAGAFDHSAASPTVVVLRSTVCHAPASAGASPVVSASAQVVRSVLAATPDFRVLALSATPGADLAGVQALINNLLIARIELRTDEDPDVSPYTHAKLVDKVVVPGNNELRKLKGAYERLAQVPLQRLRRVGVYDTGLDSVSHGKLTRVRDACRGKHLDKALMSQVEHDVAMLMSLCHGWGLLNDHGFGALQVRTSGGVPGGVWSGAQGERTVAPRAQCEANVSARPISPSMRQTVSTGVRENVGRG